MLENTREEDNDSREQRLGGRRGITNRQGSAAPSGALKFRPAGATVPARLLQAVDDTREDLTREENSPEIIFEADLTREKDSPEIVLGGAVRKPVDRTGATATKRVLRPLNRNILLTLDRRPFRDHGHFIPIPDLTTEDLTVEDLTDDLTLEDLTRENSTRENFRG